MVGTQRVNEGLRQGDHPSVPGQALIHGALELGLGEFGRYMTALTFGNVVTGVTSAAQSLTLHNTGGAALSGITAVVTAPFKRSGGTCGATLATGGTCTIIVVFSPTALSTVNATLTITGSVAVTGSPVSLSGTGVAPVISATLTPTTWNAAAGESNSTSVRPEAEGCVCN